MLVLGIDPGTAAFGWCLLEVPPGMAKARYIASGICKHATGAHAALFRAHHPDLVCIEEPEQAGNEAATGALLPTSWNGGIMEGVAEANGVRVQALHAREGRKALTTDGAAKDPKIRANIPRIVDGMPSDVSPHENDAAVAAWWGARMPPQMRELRRTKLAMKFQARGHKANHTRRMNKAAKARAGAAQ